MEGKEQLRKYNNGRRHTPDTKRRARLLRRKGTSYKEIAHILGISNGSSHLWTSDIKLSASKLEKIKERARASLNHKNLWSPAQRQAIGKRLQPFRLQQKKSKEILIEEIRNFYKEFGRIPLKKEFNSRRSFRTQFGTWNNAIIAAGFKPNPVFFAERVQAKDGHICDSFAERIIDDWLTANTINHERAVRYPKSKMTADFYIPIHQIYIEFFGLHGASKKYDANHDRKLNIAKDNRIKLICLYMDDILKKTFIQKLKLLLSNAN